MRDYLLFRLYGPLAAWGGIAVGEFRPSFGHPSKSAVLGLVAGALGLRRTDQASLDALAAGYGFAVRADTPGEVLRDFHTAQVPSRQKRIFMTRKDELAGPNHDLNTILSSRDYRVEALYTVALWARPHAPYTLNVLADTLRRPRFVPYLGRKSCPLALPMQPQITSAAALPLAFSQVQFAEATDLLPDFTPKEQPGPFRQMLKGSYLPEHNSAALYYDLDADIQEMEAATHIQIRRDQAGNRLRWHFTERQEGYARLAWEREAP